MKRLLISEEEKKNILNLYNLLEQEDGSPKFETGVNPMSYWNKYGKNPKVWQSMLLCAGANLGNYGPLKNGVDGQFGNTSKKELKRILNTNDSTLSYDNFMQLLTKTGYKCLTKHIQTNQSTEKKVVKPSDDDKKQVKKTQQEGEYSCIVVSKDICKKISKNTDTSIGSDKDTYQCAAYVIKCLAQYENLLNKNITGNAWTMFDSVKNSGGDVKYNAFDSSYNWGNLQSKIKDLKYTSKKCEDFKSKPIQPGSNVDEEVDSNKLSNAIAKNYPRNSSVNLQNLELGDVVGIYLRTSSNKGRAFCDSAKLDKNGNIIEKNPINTHVGFIGAIKDNQPIVFHNIHGDFKATPARNLLSANGSGMIVWAVSDPDVIKNIQKRNKIESGQQEPTFYEKYFESPLYDIKRKIGY